MVVILSFKLAHLKLSLENIQPIFFPYISPERYIKSERKRTEIHNNGAKKAVEPSDGMDVTEVNKLLLDPTCMSDNVAHYVTVWRQS